MLDLWEGMDLDKEMGIKEVYGVIEATWIMGSH